MSSEDMCRDEVASLSVVCGSLSKLSTENESNQPVEFESTNENRDVGATEANSTDFAAYNHHHFHEKPSCSDRALLQTCRSLESLCHYNGSMKCFPANLSISMPTLSVVDMLRLNAKAMMRQQISSPKASLITDFPTSETPSKHDNLFKVTENHDTSTNYSKSKSASIISKQNSCEDVVSQHSCSSDDSSDDSLLPGSRRRRLAASVDSDNSDSDDNLLFDEAKSDRQVKNHDCNELVNASSSPEPTCQDLVVSGSAEETQTVDHTATDEEVPSVELDADRDKSNPAYVPRTGTYFMHDYRESDNGASSGNMLKGRADQHKWTHDRFRYHDQAPRSSRELIRKYGYDIRNGPYDQKPSDARESDDTESHIARDVPSCKSDHVDPSTSTGRNDSSGDRHYEPRTNSRHPKRSSAPKNHYPEQAYSKFRSGRGRFTTSSHPKTYMDFSNEPRRPNAIPRKAHHHPVSDDCDTMESAQNKQFSRKSDSFPEKKLVETHAESKPMRYSALRQNAPRVCASDTVGDKRNVVVPNESDGYQNAHASYSAHLGHSQRQFNQPGRNSRKPHTFEKINPFRSDTDAPEANGFPGEHQGRTRYDTQPRQTQPGRRPGFGRRPLKPLEPRNPYPRDSGWLQST